MQYNLVTIWYFYETKKLWGPLVLSIVYSRIVEPSTQIILIVTSTTIHINIAE